MNICLLSASDGREGAFVAARRLHQGLVTAGADACMFVGRKSSEDPSIKTFPSVFVRGWTRLAPHIDTAPLRLYPNRKRTAFSLAWVPDQVVHQVNELAPAVINIHWVCDGFLRLGSLRHMKRPLVWTLHDMWPFTGGCHYGYDCDKYQSHCGNCPQLASDSRTDLSWCTWKRKSQAYQDLALTIVCPSTWLAERARSSSLMSRYRIEVIPNALNVNEYRPIDKSVARELLGLPKDRKLILFGAVNAVSDNRKGYDKLVLAVNKYLHGNDKTGIELLVFGSSKPATPMDVRTRVRYLGRLHDDISLSLVYSAADVMIVPSTQEAFGQTASEAMACGIPVVAFDGTGLKDIVDHQVNGYLASPFSTENLADGIAWVLENDTRRRILSSNARAKAVTTFSSQIVAQRYLDLYREIVLPYYKSHT